MITAKAHDFSQGLRQPYFDFDRGPILNPFAIRNLPGVVIRSLPAKSAMSPSSISRALCSAGITAAGSETAQVFPTASKQARKQIPAP
jgi:hypothetical protein